MSNTKPTIWDLEPHTEAKHKILKEYINAWIPIMAKYHNRIIYIDAFAGPGIYSKRELGSPIIVIGSAIKHNTTNKFELICLLIEKDIKRTNCLKMEIEKMHVPAYIKIDIENGDSNAVLESLLNKLDANAIKIAPMFVFVDPFNYDISFELIKKLFNKNKCEIFISFMYSGIIRNIPNETEKQKLDRFFGTTDWRTALSLDCDKKRRFLHDLYASQLVNLGRDGNKEETLFRSFEMIDETNNTAYFLFYVTKNTLGLEKMKEAMWNVDKRGTFCFSDITDPNQTFLFSLDETFKLEKLIENEFRNRTISVTNIKDFVIKRTAFLPKHMRDVLERWERNGSSKIQVISGRKRRFTFPPSTILKIM
ncbi:MAG: three-Cys-motif partner protein TcmP [Candidatus Aenigmarchaeota archaeon]|nr:three-Cys-motif partner protein TcmP [Candidatus Aenigmarchaeota archaeon]